MFEIFIAKKYVRAKHKLNFIRILSLISTLGITIGVAALVIVLAVFNGFGSTVTKILVNFEPHLKITVNDNTETNLDSKFFNELKNRKDVVSCYTFLEGKTLFINQRTYDVVNLKGIELANNSKSWDLSSNLISGKYDLTGNKVLLGLSLALKLSVRVGDTLVATSAYNIEKTITTFGIPLSKKFIIAGIFESNNKDYDAGYAITSLKNTQQLFGLGKSISGYEVRLNNFKNSESFKEEISSSVPKNFRIQTWADLHKQLYSVMLIERWAAYILLCLIIAVASFNIFASLLMTVLEKKKDIGIMRSLGVSKNSIQKIFLTSGMLVGLAGTLSGLLIGLLVCFLQINYNFYPLDPTKYIIDALPIELRFSDIIAISSMALMLTFLAAYFPSKRAANTIIIESIKYE